MYNFLDPKLSPKVFTETPAMDNYEITNLISENFVTKARGFLAYSTIKPPVEIVFELICLVNIHYVILWTSAGNQKCTAIEVLAKNSNTNFIPIAHARFQNSGIVFCNGRLYSTNNPPPNTDRTFSLNFFKQSSFRSFTSANSIKVCILRTEKSVPCLAKIEIWGKPSKICSLVTIETINRLMLKSSHVTETESVCSTSSKPDDFEIPEEFKDSLTYDIMSFPITLPSGNSIDQSTLEKYIASERVYGRPPSDPFTGQIFTDNRKPVLNTALKSRIDLFLVQHSDKPETFTLKRSLGRTTKPSVTSLVNEKDFGNTKKVKYNEETTSSESNSTDPEEVLSEAIKKVINSSNFVRFTLDSDKNVSANRVTKCIKCENTESLYKTPCNHLYCKKCLIVICKDLKCSYCDKKFCKSEITRFHF